MDRQQALSQMILPSQRRTGKPRGGVLQIHVTRTCDLACYHCTQGSNLRGLRSFISVENFELALMSLRSYFGIVGVFGGNPALHPEFPTLCNLVRIHVPRRRAGIWCNHPRGHGREMRSTFDPGYSNLNVHLKQEAFDEFKRDWPESRPFGLKSEDDSRHSPTHVAMKDIVDEGECWNLIANCDINKYWSAMMCEIRGTLYGYFCEVAGAQAILHQDDPDWPITGIPVAENLEWWKLGMDAFENQVDQHCLNCGVPLRGYGQLAQQGTGPEQVSETHANIYHPKSRERLVELVTDINQLDSRNLKFTEYLQGAKK